MSDFPERANAEFVLKLPFPPSVNNYYGRTRTGRVFIKTPGKEFRSIVVEALREIPEAEATLKTERLQVWVEAVMPDRRRRDLDNIKKALLDSLTHAGVWSDDEQIDDLRVVRSGVDKPGHVRVHIGVLDGD